MPHSRISDITFLPFNVQVADIKLFANTAGEKSKIEDVYCYAERVPSLQDYICYPIARNPYSIYVEFIYKPLTLHVPKASIEQYKTHEWWNLKRGAPAAMVAGVPFLLQL